MLYGANSSLVNRPLPHCRPTPSAFHRPPCGSLPCIPPTTSQRLLQQLHLAGSYTLGRMSLGGQNYTTSFNSTPPHLFTISRPLRRFTPARTALSPPRPSWS